MTGLVITWALFGAGTGTALASATRQLMNTRRRTAVLIAVAAPVTAVMFGLVASRWPMMPGLLAMSVFAATAVQLAQIDVADQRLPRALVWPISTTTLGLLCIEAFARAGGFNILLRAVIGAAALAGFYFVAGLASRGGIGAGDVRLAVPVGLILGWHGWPSLAAGTIFGLLGTCVAAAFSTARTDNRGTIPHGPCMLAGAFVAAIL